VLVLQVLLVPLLLPLLLLPLVHLLLLWPWSGRGPP
jgi:hypothetical protein